MRRLRVYVAGPYSADNVIKVLDNIRDGNRVSTEVLMMGLAPFSPWLDYLFQLMLRPDRGEKLEVKDYYEYSMAWLEASDVMLVLPGYETSKGTLAEIKRAVELGIKVYYSLGHLQYDVDHGVIPTQLTQGVQWPTV